MDIRINFDSDIAIYMQLKNEMIRLIAEGKLVNGDSLPSVRSLAEDIGINLHTVNKAYNLLKVDGYIQLDRRKGAIVSVSKCDNDMMDNLKEQMSIMINQCICKGVEKKEVVKIINELYLGGDRKW